MKDAVILFLATYKDNSEKITVKEWNLIAELRIVFRPLYAATIELSGEKFTTLSKVLPLTSRLLTFYAKINHNDSLEAKEVRKSIHDSLKVQFKEVESNELLTNATIFDPRFKDYFFKKTKRQEAISNAKYDAHRENHVEEAMDCPSEEDEQQTNVRDFMFNNI